jgi:hypothetical protein
MGVQRCSDDGSSFEACNCNPAGSGGAGGGGGSAGRAGSSGAAGTQAEAPFTGATGLACETDDDCLGGLTCIPSTSATNPFGPGGVQRGICTSVCADGQAGSDACQAVDSLSECILFQQAATEGFCLPLCLVGVASAQRCGGRVDMACIQSMGIDPTGQVGLCRPLCSSDIDCGGRSCDLGTGFCVDALPARGPGVIGAACNAATAMTDCISGRCLDLEADGSGFCTAACVLGSPAGCGFEQAAATRDAACFPTSQAAVLGDRGVCVELCDVEADCAQASYTCSPLTAQGQTVLGRVGSCIPPEEGADAGADAN